MLKCMLQFSAKVMKILKKSVPNKEMQWSKLDKRIFDNLKKSINKVSLSEHTLQINRKIRSITIYIKYGLQDQKSNFYYNVFKW